VAAGLAYVPAERRSQGLILEESIETNLTLASLGRLTRRGIFQRARARKLADEWMARLEIAAPHSSTPVERLSGGTQQKVLLARWLMVGARVLLLDEPTRGVDITTKLEIYKLLHALVDEGRVAVVVMSSDLDEVVALGQRVLVLSAGSAPIELRTPTKQQLAHHALARKRETHTTTRTEHVL
jgi:ABC-type sugar transport system ATPase subunit